MSKQSGWVVVATEGTTVDGRKITASWIKEMAASYSVEEYTALIWPEHHRSHWGAFEGRNWGTVDALKEETKDGKLRLLAKITANNFLLDANKEGQKLFTSIEAQPDYRGTGKCYLVGLAVTDSPASAGTTRLKFSMGANSYDREYSHLEPFIFTDEQQPKDTALTKEQLQQAVTSALQPFSVRLEQLEQQLANKPEPSQPEPEQEQKSVQLSTEHVSAALGDALAPLASKLESLETKFNQLLQEAQGQRPAGEGASSAAEAF